MSRNVVITGAGRDLGRTLAVLFARRGDCVFLSARDARAADRTRDEITADGAVNEDGIHSYRCDLNEPDSIRQFAADVAADAGRVDVLVNNAAAWLEGSDLEDADDEEIATAVSTTVTGTVLMAKHFLPLLLESGQADMVTMVSAAGIPRAYNGPAAHSAYFATKSGQAGFVSIMSARLRSKGVRVISLYPPDFTNVDPLSAAWSTVGRSDSDELTSASVADCIMFAIDQPRDCFIEGFHFAPRRVQTG